jgi:NADH pyrophosphatase NudC (nudix superfamily)
MISVHPICKEDPLSDPHDSSWSNVASAPGSRKMKICANPISPVRTQLVRRMNGSSILVFLGTYNNAPLCARASTRSTTSWPCASSPIPSRTCYNIGLEVIYTTSTIPVAHVRSARRRRHPSFPRIKPFVVVLIRRPECGSIDS